MRIHTTHTRDAALYQLRRLNRWLIAGSVVLTGAFAEAAANAFPGKTVASTGTRARATGTSSSHSTTHPLNPPSQPPKASTEAGGSDESTPAQETQQAQPSAPTPEGQAATPEAPRTETPAPSQESQPEPQAPAQESAPAQQAPSEPTVETTGPTVSGGS